MTTGLTVAATGTAIAATTPSAVSYSTVVPSPMTAKQSGAGYSSGTGTAIAAGPGATDLARYLAGAVRRSTGLPLPVVGLSIHPAGITLTLSGAPSRVGDQGYQLEVDPTGVVVKADRAAGLFAGVQTLRQLLAAAADSTHKVPGP